MRPIRARQERAKKCQITVDNVIIITAKAQEPREHNLKGNAAMVFLSRVTESTNGIFSYDFCNLKSYKRAININSMLNFYILQLLFVNLMMSGCSWAE